MDGDYMTEENLNYMDKLELDIFLESFLNNVMDLYNMDVIELFTESEGTLQSGAKIVTFFDKIITGIKEFIQKIKNMINKKIRERKIKHVLSGIKNSSIKTMKSLDSHGLLTENDLQKYYNETKKVMKKYTKMIATAKDNDELKIINEKFKREIDSLNGRFQEIAKKNKKVSIDDCEKVLKSNLIDKFERMTEECILDIKESMNKKLNKKFSDNSVSYKSTATKVVTTSSKAINFVGRHKEIATVVIATSAAVVGGKIGSKIGKNEKK